MLAVQVHTNVPGVLDHGVRHVEEVHGAVVAELPLLVGEVDLGPGEDLDVSAVMVVDVEGDSAEAPDPECWLLAGRRGRSWKRPVEGEVELEGSSSPLLPAQPFVSRY